MPADETLSCTNPPIPQPRPPRLRQLARRGTGHPRVDRRSRGERFGFGVACGALGCARFRFSEQWRQGDSALGRRGGYHFAWDWLATQNAHDVAEDRIGLEGLGLEELRTETPCLREITSEPLDDRNGLASDVLANPHGVHELVLSAEQAGGALPRGGRYDVVDGAGHGTVRLVVELTAGETQESQRRVGPNTRLIVIDGAIEER